jgi:hypothetical protein
MSLTWNGDKVLADVDKAIIYGIDKTMSQCVVSAKQNHPGWKNITGTAEGSVRVTQFAARRGGVIFGVWGSVDVDYMIWLELKHGSALRRSADTNYRHLAANIKEGLAR